MPGRRFFAWSLALSTLAVAAPRSWAEDEEPAAPAAKEKGGEIEETIAKDWSKKIKGKLGAANSKERAEYWEKKGVVGKDLFWLGLIWDRAKENAKAVAALEGALKAPDLKEGNKEFARQTLITLQARMRDWPKMIAAAEAFRADFPTSGVAQATWVDQGRALRMAGDKAKAIAAFTEAADANNLTAILELIDLHLAEGDAEAAKAVLTKYAEADIKGKEQYYNYFKDFIAAVGTPAPSIADAKSVGKGAGPTSYEGKPTLLYYWHMQVTAPDKKLQFAAQLADAYRDQIQVAAIGTYNKYSPETSKKDPAMTEEQELDLYRKFIESFGRGMPAAIVVPKETIEGLKLKFEGTKVLIDKDGKFRYARTFENAPYGWDWTATELATKKLLGS